MKQRRHRQSRSPLALWLLPLVANKPAVFLLMVQNDIRVFFTYVSFCHPAIYHHQSASFRGCFCFVFSRWVLQVSSACGRLPPAHAARAVLLLTCHLFVCIYFTIYSYDTWIDAIGGILACRVQSDWHLTRWVQRRRERGQAAGALRCERFSLFFFPFFSTRTQSE